MAISTPYANIRWPGQQIPRRLCARSGQYPGCVLPLFPLSWWLCNIHSWREFGRVYKTHPHSHQTSIARESITNMPPKFDPNEIKIGRPISVIWADNFDLSHSCFLKFSLYFLLVYLRATGGEVGATSALAPKIGPLGLVRNKKKYLRNNCRKFSVCLQVY